MRFCRSAVQWLVCPVLAMPVVADARPRVDESVRLGQWTHVKGPRVRADKVVSDSRCPENARCIRAGEVTLAVTVNGGRWTNHMMLTLGKPAQIADGMLTLTEVLPGRRTEQKLRPRNYRFKFRFVAGL